MIDYRPYGVDTSNFIKEYRISDDGARLEVTYVDGSTDYEINPYFVSVMKQRLDDRMEEEAREVLIRKFMIEQTLYTLVNQVNDKYADQRIKRFLLPLIVSIWGMGLFPGMRAEIFSGAVFTSAVSQIALKQKQERELDQIERAFADLRSIAYYFALKNRGCDCNMNDILTRPMLELQQLVFEQRQPADDESHQKVKKHKL